MESCPESGDRYNFSLNVSIHVAILFAFLSVFFTFFVAKLTSDLFKEEIKHNIHNLTDSLDHTDPKMKTMLSSVTKDIPLKDMASMYNEPDKTVEMNNKWLFRALLLANIILIVGILVSIVVVKYSCGKCPPIKEILVENGIIFAFIGIIEYLFFTHIALKFIPVKPSTMVDRFFEDVKNIL
jgi:hypothetical protein